jgi:hypothetical protein
MDKMGVKGVGELVQIALAGGATRGTGGCGMAEAKD